MNQCLPDWNFEADLPAFTQKKPTRQDPELVELLWRNGQVVLQSQTQRKPCPNSNDRRQTNKHDEKTLRGSATYWNSSNLIPDEDTVSWIQYPLEDSFEKEFCSNFFSEMPSSDILEADKVIRQSQAEHCLKIGASVATPTVTNLQQPDFSGNPMPPPKFQFTNSRQQNKGEGVITSFANFSQFTAPIKGDSGSFIQNTGGKVSGNLTQREGKEFPAMTVGSSYCGSNQVLNDLDISRASSIGIGTTATGLSAGPLKHDAGKVSLSETRKTETIEPTLTSSSGGSGTSSGRTCKQSTGVSCHKRKSRDAEESEHQTEAAELESAGGSKPTRRSGSARRSRAAEVHNLSERRRRDRINEKMRALQELIPHCNKTDKASMLDEAIEYLKSLQLQLQAFQLMWMGNGMAPMLFPGVQHYMSRMGMGMGPPALSSFQNAMHLPRVPLVDQSMSMAATQNQAVMCQNPVLNPFNYQNQIQSPAFSEQFARYMGFHHMQNGSQATNGFGFGSQPQCQTMAPPASSNGTFFPGSTTDKVPPSSGTG